MTEEIHSLEDGAVAQRPSRGKNYRLISISLAGIIISLLLSADWRIITLRDSLIMISILAPAFVALTATWRKKIWSSYAALGVTFFWLLIASWRVLVMIGIIKFLLPHLYLYQVIADNFGLAFLLLGITSSIIGKSYIKAGTKIFAFSIFLISYLVVIGAEVAIFGRNIHEDEVEHYTKLIKHYPNDLLLHENRARLFLYLRNEDKAMEDIDMAIKLGSKDPELYKGFGLHLFFGHKFDSAISIFSKGMAFCGSDSVKFSRLLFFRGWAYLRMRNYDSSIADLRRVNNIALLNNVRGLSYYLISQSFLIMGQYDSAIAEYKKEKGEIQKGGMKDFEDTLGFRYSEGEIVRLYCAKGNYLSALHSLDDAIHDGLKITSIGYDAGIVNYLCRNYKEAKQDFESYLSFAKGDENAEYYFSSLLAKKGRKKEAVRHFDKALQLGFRFFDLVNENDDLKLLRNEPAYHKLLRDHFKNGGIHAEMDTLDQIYKQDKIIYRDHPYVDGQDRLLFSEHSIATDRADAIFWMQDRQKEFRKLEQLITEE